MDSNLEKEIKIFYASISIFAFASSLVEIFIPLYLLNRGFSLSMILLFYALAQASRFAFMPLCAAFSSSFGAKKALSVAFILSIIFYILMRSVDRSQVMFYFSSVLYGAVMAFHFLSYLVHQSKIVPDGKRGRTVGRLGIYSALAGAMGPLVGGLIITKFGFRYVFIAAILFIVPAIILLLSTAEKSKIRKITFRAVKIKKIYRDIVANGFYNFQSFTFMVLWPMFIFIIVGQYNTTGSIQSVSLAVSIIAFYMAGKFTDKIDRKKMIFRASILNTFVDLFFVFANSLWSVLALNIASVFSGSLQAVPWSAKIQEHSDRESRTEYLALFEMGGALIASIGFLLLMLLTNSLGMKMALILGIVLSSLAGLFINLIRE